MANGKEGSYLLRESTRTPGDYSLSVRCAESVKHFQIAWDGRNYTFGMGKFATLRDFADHFESQPMIGGESGVLTLLRYPYPRHVEEPSKYDTVTVHAELGRSMAHGEKSNDVPPVLSIASKEGYLTKLGKNVKNWKTRWFVLYKNELRYYKTRTDKTPIRVIDLKTCSDIAPDPRQEKSNCFRVVTKTRTFFIYASSSQEMHEWLEILRWRLNHVTS